MYVKHAKYNNVIRSEPDPCVKFQYSSVTDTTELQQHALLNNTTPLVLIYYVKAQLNQIAIINDNNTPTIYFSNISFQLSFNKISKIKCRGGKTPIP